MKNENGMKCKRSKYKSLLIAFWFTLAADINAQNNLISRSWCVEFKNQKLTLKYVVLPAHT
jgi:hypothetical protein